MEGLEATGGQIHKLMADAMAKINAIPKSRKPSEGSIKFAYRGIDDLYNAFHAIFAELGIYVTFDEINPYKAEEVVTKKTYNGNDKESVNTMRGFMFKIRFNAADGSYATTWSAGEGVDTADKAAGKASSYAMKSALIHTFLVPTVDLEDPDASNPELDKPGTYQAPPIVELKDKIIALMQVRPPVFNADWMKYADESCKKNDIAGLKACEEEAKNVMAERSPK